MDSARNHRNQCLYNREWGFLLGLEIYLSDHYFFSVEYESVNYPVCGNLVAKRNTDQNSDNWIRDLPGGSMVFFSTGIKAGEPTGIIITIVGLFGFALFGILSRAFAREKQINTLILTAFPLGFGGGVLLILGVAIEGVPHLSWQVGGILFWLALANTAVAYMLYNHSLQILTALEMNVMLNLSPLGTALLAWLLLGERLSLLKFIGMVVVIAGVILVQQKNKNSSGNWD